jgi:hypothetical protein
MSKLTDEQLLLEAVGLLDRLSARLGADIYIGNRRAGEYTDGGYYLVKVGNMSVANADPVVALYEAMGKCGLKVAA